MPETMPTTIAAQFAWAPIDAWASAAANMRMYTLLRDRAAAFRADPEVQEALAAARVTELSQPTLSAGETVADLRASDADFDPDAVGARGANFIQLTQLMVEHVMGARG